MKIPDNNVLDLKQVSPSKNKEIKDTSDTDDTNKSSTTTNSVFANKNDNKDKATKDKIATGDEIGKLLGSLDINFSGKPILPQFNAISEQCTTIIQNTVNTFSAKVNSIYNNLNPESSDYEQKLQEAKQEIESLRQDAKKELNKANATIIASEEVSSILMDEYGKDDAKTVPVDEIKQNIIELMNSNESDPSKLKKIVKDLIDKFKKDEKEKEKNKDTTSTHSANSTKKTSNKTSLNIMS